MRYSPRLYTEDYIEDKRWVRLVAEHLYNGSLALVLGAGASAGLGLPPWGELVRRCLDDASIVYDPKHLSEPERLGLYIDELEERYPQSEYQDRVANALYRDARLGADVCQAPLLIALGALLMGSRRGSVREVVTFNFDVVLEYYLSLHGYAIQTYDELPVLQTAEDVRIAHINGVLSHAVYPTRRSKRLIFSAKSLHARSGAQLDEWKDRFRELLKAHLVLFVGVSGSDPIFFPLLTDVSDTLASDRVTGVWMFGKDIDLDPDSVYRKRDFIARNVVPICLSSYDDIPAALLEVCQLAASEMR